MNCSQILPGAVNPSPCSLATGYCSGNPFVVYASGKDVILLDSHLQHIQTIFGSNCGYGETKVFCIHCAETTGRLAVAWGAEVVVFEASPIEELYSKDESLEKKFLFEWNAVQTLSLEHAVFSICWSRDGLRLVTGGSCLILWEDHTPSLDMGKPIGSQQAVDDREEEWRRGCILEVVWRCDMAGPISHVKFSPYGNLFATCGHDDCLVKIWYPVLVMGTGIGTPPIHSFCYVAHPQSVQGFVWRRVTPSLPRGCIPNVLLTHCSDNICRIWSHALTFNKKGHLRFFIAASIDPVADIPFRTTVPLGDQPFIVHWLNNKETTLSSKVEKYQKGIPLPISHFSSLQSFTSNLNEEMLQSWVCIDDDDEPEDLFPSKLFYGIGMGGGLGGPIGGLSKSEVELGSVAGFSRKTGSLHGHHSLSAGTGVGERPVSSSFRPVGSPGHNRVSLQHRRALSHLLDEWCSTPDLLLCIHPSVGSLMVWIVEGIDAPPNLERLVHVSFSSCLPHVFPPHLSLSLQPDLLQFLTKEPDLLHAREANTVEGLNGRVSASIGTDISLPVPQIRLLGSGSMSAMSHLEVAEDVRKVKADSTLMLVSSHTNGSLNTWSVELTIQSNYCTSIAGLIHCAGTGGHRSEVTQISRHPWLPVLMTISSSASCGSDDVGVGKECVRDRVSELIIWNADLPGPLQHKSRLNELSRMTSPDPSSFNHVTWVPPISMGTQSKGALARCPSLGLFVANVGKELALFQASLYSITKPQPSSFMQSDKEKGKLDRRKKDADVTSSSSLSPPSSDILLGIKVTSQLGMKGVELVSIVERDLSTFQEVVGLYVFRMCSLVTTFDLKASMDSKFSKDVVLVLLENKKPLESHAHLSRSGSSSALGSGSKGTRSYLHMWRLTICSDMITPASVPHHTSQTDSSKDFVGTNSTASGTSLKQEVVHTCIVHKVSPEPFLLPLPSGTFVVKSSPACDVSSSLQLQTPTLSAPYLFSTACSDGTVHCWQFNLCQNTAHSSPATAPEKQIPEDKEQAEIDISFDVYEVFDSGSKTSEFSKLKPSVIDCYDEEVIRSLPTESFVPIGLKVAYPGRMAMAHLLSKPVKQPQHQRHRSSPSSSSRPYLISKDSNPLDRHSMVTLWECESSGGLRWSCEAMLMLVGVAQVAASTGKDERAGMSVFMEWVPMENGAYLLATCFASTISIFGMALHQEAEQFGMMSKRTGLQGVTTPTMTQVEAQASWVCLLQFPCFRPTLDLPVNCLAYTGSNSLVLSIGTEIHLYSCWVQRDKLVPVAYSPRVRWQHSRGKLDNSKGGSYGGGLFPGGGINPKHSDLMNHLEDTSVVNLLDYAHAWNTPLPQYHPKVLLELMNSGRLVVVKSVLVNLVRFLLLYQTKKKAGDEEDGGEMNWSYFDEEEMHEDDGRRKRKKHLSLTSDGYLERSRHSRPIKWVETVPHLPLAKMGIISDSSKGDVVAAVGHLEPLPAGGSRGSAPISAADDYDELFSMGTTLTNLDGPVKFGFEDEEEEEEEEIYFTDLSPDTTEFTPKLAHLLASILECYHLVDLTDLDHIQLLSIAQTVASTNMGLGTHSAFSTGDEDSGSKSTAGLSFSSLSGAGYASSAMTSKGREAMDDCGLRYLLALECSISLSKCLPEGVSPTPLPPSSLVWAFHSDAETELLSALPCVQEDDLKWEELRKAGVGWWLRSLDTLRRLIEKLAKALFMKKQDPLDACLFYLAMKKQSLIKGLFKSVSDSRMATFFSNDFTSDRWKKAAQKNAFALLAKQRFAEAAAFFLLANKLWDAVEVCVSRLNDFQLAFVLVRLYEGDHGSIYQRFLKEHILGMPSQPHHGSPTKNEGDEGQRGSFLEASPDPFLRSMAHWLLQDFSGSLETFLINPEGANNTSSGSRVDGLRVFLTHPAIFNFYSFLRMHPVLLRRDHKTSFLTTSTTVSSGRCRSYGNSLHHLSSVGDEPLTAVERSLLFSTAYYHLCHGCPLLALNVFSRIPKSGDLGADICEQKVRGAGSNKQQPSQFSTKFLGGEGVGSVMSGMIDECGTLGKNLSSAGMAKESRGAAEVIIVDDIDWGTPISGRTCKRFEADLEEEVDELDWSQPFISSNMSGREASEEEEEVDWSKPISSTRMDFSLDTPGLSPTNMDANREEGGEKGHQLPSSNPSLLTPRGLFVLTLACQLQYNACLSILTEELHSIYVPACCQFLWEVKGGKGRQEAILPLVKRKDKSELKLVQHYSKNAFDPILQNLHGTLVDWLNDEACAVKWVCHLWVESDQEVKGEREDSVNIETADASAEHAGDVVVASAPPSGYDLLTTLMNYLALHAATSPSLLTVKFELMHLVNTTLPWGTGYTHHHTSSAFVVSPHGKDTQLSFTRTPEASLSLPDIVPTLAFSPSQLPILTSCSLPVRHLTNLATHLRLLSDCVIQALSDHTFPPISTQPLPQVRRIFELCCAISHCLTVSLNPVQLSEFSATALPMKPRAYTSPVPTTGRNVLTSSLSSLRRTPTPAAFITEQQYLQETKTTPIQTRTLPSQFKTPPPSQSQFLRRRLDSFNNLDSTIGSPNTKPSKWPGMSCWPCTLTSDEGRDPTPMSVVMVECIVSVYIGLLATAWSQHSIEDLLVLLRNAPSVETWYCVAGGGIDGKKTERVSKNLFFQTIESVSKKLHLPKKNSPTPQEEDMASGVFVAPRRTLLDVFLSPHTWEERTRIVRDEMKGDCPDFFVVRNMADEEEEEEDIENYDQADDTFSTDGITFQVGGGEGGAETSPTNPNCFAWCVMNLCISKQVQQVVRRMVACVGLEVLELITVSPLIYSTLKVLDEWESIFSRRLVALGEPPDDLFGDSDMESSKFKIGLALMRQKFILEPENSPFRGRDWASRSAKKLWKFFVHQDGPRETILQCVFVRKNDSLYQIGGGVADDVDSDLPMAPTCRVIHKEADCTVSAICFNSCCRVQTSVMALALPREVMEIEVPDNSILDNSGMDPAMENGLMSTSSSSLKKIGTSHHRRNEDFIVVQSTSQLHRSSAASMFSPVPVRYSLPVMPVSSFGSTSQLVHKQTGNIASLLLRRPTTGVKRMAPHPSLAYYLTGSLDGSVTMWEFGTYRHVACQRPPGMGGGVTKIRFTPEGNKFGVTDSSGRLSLWQGIHNSARSAYHILHSHMKYLSDFLFLSSSSLIATCGDGVESRNLYLWDTLMPTNRSIVREFPCHEGGATALGYSRTKQRLFCGGKKGEVCIFDIRQSTLLQTISLHSSSINCIVVNDIDGYFVTGAADGDIKIIDASTLAELASFPGQHAKTRLFRHGEGGVTDLDILPGGKLYSCGADGSVKCQTLRF